MEQLIRDMTRQGKVILWLAVDACLVPVALYAAFALRLGTPSTFPMMQSAWALFPLLVVGGVAVFYVLGLPRIKLHSFDAYAMRRIGMAALMLTGAAMILSYLFDLWAPRSVPLIFGAIFFGAAVVMRLLGLALLQAVLGRLGNAVPVAVYGAGAAGIQLASALRQSNEVKPVVFVDDNPALWGLLISGLQVKNPKELAGLAASGKIARVLLAMPSISRTRQSKLVVQLSELNCDVQVMPSYADLVVGKGLTETTTPVAPDALLGRDKVDLDIPDVAKAYAGRAVMVTGAGGSIGSELCRQLLDIKPSHIVLFERSEFELYKIDNELRALAEAVGIKVTTRLGSVVDARRVREVLTETGAEIVIHAAAYKHVPLVEENELEGARNNVLGTQVVAEAAHAAGVERFILISTDKAVRPTNIMGATKRLAELVVQDLQTRSEGTKFSMVRFGNVLGSSGSVLPLFEKQIRRGGPVTVTHPEVTRFFMTIPEAARLVLLAGAYATGGDVFVLDMGKPMKILDIARRMIALSGRKVLENGEGDIEIKITGLRPGEKLYEELLIDDASLCGTPHSKILRAEEAMLSQIEIAAMLRELNKALEAGDTPALRALIAARVDGYHQLQNFL
ncbi:polysaccharide biosynthesis protein [Planktotalea arctica]|uniref:polysaccharide biosynthesis protein n=1 Tax=Planktotalea arctica TaxID=1481893 RepID=UPI000A16E992|nr:nucleoside-diphosphate sugar epimerase/dehydratase [Planktotalea arctica]